MSGSRPLMVNCARSRNSSESIGTLDVIAPRAERPDRVVHIDSGPVAIARREAALSVMEPSAGQSPAHSGNSHGFRLGPKSFMTDGINITLFPSPDDPARGDDMDLAFELREQFPDPQVQTIVPCGHIDVPMPIGSTWSTPHCVAEAHVRGVIWAQDLDPDVDDPIAGSSTLSRVACGVTFCPVTT